MVLYRLISIWWKRQDLDLRNLSVSDLQSDAFDHFATLPIGIASWFCPKTSDFGDRRAAANTKAIWY